MRGEGLSRPREQPYFRTHRSAGPARRHRPDMIKTFSFSALFFMTVGVLCATHIGLPF